MPTDGDDLDQGWGRLIDAVRAGGHAHTEAALGEIVGWWWEEDEGDWVNFHLDAGLAAGYPELLYRTFSPFSDPAENA